MKIATRAIFRLTDNPHEYIPVSEDSYQYAGPLALADRSVQNAAGAGAKTAAGTAGGYGTSAGDIGASIIPTLTQEATHPTGYDPTTENDMLVAGEQGAGGTNAAITGQAGLNAMRTRNSGATSSILDQAARRMGQTNSQNALGVENASAKLAQQKQQQALGQLGGLYGTDVGAQLKAMGIQDEDLNTQLNAGKSGWLQQLEGVPQFGYKGASGSGFFA